MVIILIIVVLLALLYFFILLVRGGIGHLDHYEMLSIAVDDYLKDPDNFDISHYPDVTWDEIQRELKRQSEAKKRGLQGKCNDNPDFIFDE